MNSILNAQAPAHFLTGLALLAIAGMIGVALRRAVGQRALGCGLATLISLALAQWSELAAGALARPTIYQALRLVCEMIALVGLIELGRLCTTGPRAGLLPRWSYPMVAALTLAAALLPTLGSLEFILRLAIAWQAGWLAAGYFRTDKESAIADSRATIAAIDPSTVAVRSMVGGLLVYLVATCVAIPLLGMIGTLVAAGAAYVALGPSPKQSRQSRLLWRCAWPVGFVLLAAGGCYAIPTAGGTETDLLLVEMVGPAGSAGVGELPSAGASDVEPTPFGDNQNTADSEDAGGNTAAMRQAKRIGLCLSPIVVFVLLIWGLSRLPFVH